MITNTVLEVENYIKGETVDVDMESNPLDKLGLDLSNCIKMKISAGGKMRNYMGYASKEFNKDDRRLITFSGTGDAVSKVISCVEIMKRKCKQLHQINKIYFKRKEDFWDPKVDDLDRLKVTRHIPAMTVLLSKDPLDVNEPGYQAPGSFEAEWAKDTAQANAKRQANIKKKRQNMQIPKGQSKSRRGGGSGGHTRGPNPQWKRQGKDDQGQGQQQQRRRIYRGKGEGKGQSSDVPKKEQSKEAAKD